MQRIKKIGVISLAYTLTILYFIGGVLISLFLIILKKSPGNTAIAALNPALNNTSYIQIILVYPLAYAIAGFLIGLVVALLYNYTVRFTKGIAVELTIEAKSKK